MEIPLAESDAKPGRDTASCGEAAAAADRQAVNVN